MMKSNTTPKSYLKLYWRIWLILVSCLIFFRYATEVKAFTLFNCYLMPTWIVIMILNAIEGYRLRNYLEENHRQAWEDITHVSGFGLSPFSGFRSLSFLYSDDNLSDPIVEKLKANYRGIMKLTLTVFVTSPILFIIIVVLPWGS